VLRREECEITPTRAEFVQDVVSSVLFAREPEGQRENVDEAIMSLKLSCMRVSRSAMR
jgi:hypothetical protein